MQCISYNIQHKPHRSVQIIITSLDLAYGLADTPFTFTLYSIYTFLFTLNPQLIDTNYTIQHANSNYIYSKQSNKDISNAFNQRDLSLKSIEENERPLTNIILQLENLQIVLQLEVLTKDITNLDIYIFLSRYKYNTTNFSKLFIKL